MDQIPVITIGDEETIPLPDSPESPPPEERGEPNQVDDSNETEPQPDSTEHEMWDGVAAEFSKATTLKTVKKEDEEFFDAWGDKGTRVCYPSPPSFYEPPTEPTTIKGKMIAIKNELDYLYPMAQQLTTRVDVLLQRFMSIYVDFCGEDHEQGVNTWE